MTRFLFLTAIFCVAFSAAMATEIHRWTNDCYVTIQPTTRPGVEAEVFFANENIHPLAAEEFTLTLDGLTVSVRVDRGLGMLPDTMTVTPPPGYIAWPPEIVVPEGGAGTILILLEATS